MIGRFILWVIDQPPVVGWGLAVLLHVVIIAWAFAVGGFRLALGMVLSFLFAYGFLWHIRPIHF